MPPVPTSQPTPPAALPVPDTWWRPALSTAECGAADPSIPPEWAELVAEALALAAPLPHPAGAPVHTAPIHIAPDLGPEGRLLHPLQPFLAASDARAASRAATSLGPGDQGQVWSGAREWLAQRLVRLAGRTLVGELRAARRAGTLTGADPEERFDDFLRGQAAGPALADLLCRRHPVLARLLAERCLGTVEAAAELSDRLRTDRQELAAGLLDGDPGRLTRVRFGLGDPHAGGRTVALLHFDDGQRLVYKPRPPGLHARWNDLLGWFAGHHPDLAPRAVRILPRDAYGWAEFVAAGPCGSSAELGRFYERTGALLALLYALDAVDIHAENLIAAGGHPVVVDVETLFHPCWIPATDGGADPATAALAESVQRTAVLPNPLFGEHGSQDLSALGGRPGGETLEALPAWQDPGTDLMRLVRRPADWPGSDNRPVLAGRPADPADHLGPLLHGFRTAYRTIAAHADDLLAADGLLSRFAQQPVRLVVRPSQTYALLHLEATEPSLLRDHAARERGFAALRDETGHARLHTLAPHELADLLAGDIPFFTTTPAARTLRTSRGRDLPGFLAQPGLTAVAAKIRGMSPADLDRQTWLIRASLATTRQPPRHRATGPRHGTPLALVGAVRAPRPEPDRAEVDRGRVLALARGIGDDLIARASRGADRANWLGLQELGDRRASLLPMGMALADGYTGTALFLAELGRLSGTDRYRELADLAARPLPGMLRLLADNPDLAAAVGPGGFSGLGGIAYATARLAQLLDTPELRAAVPDALTALDAAAADPSAPADVADGVAGALLAARAVHAETALPAAADLVRALTRSLGSRADRGPRPDGPGFLWGRAGLAWALGERTAADPDAASAADPDPGWCSGLAGATLPARSHDRYLSLVCAADRRPLPDHSLCHGELGLLEPLLEIQPHGDPLRRASLRLLRSVERHGPGCGTTDRVPTPGLLTGLAGIGYGLLRLGFGPQIPSVLLLRPAARPRPVQREDVHHDHGPRRADQRAVRP
jgi:type 2 lantibiotic biosynthesis protein LanM